MAQTVPELAHRLNRLNAKNTKLPALLLMTDAERLPDPSALIPQLPRNSAIIVRHFSYFKKKELINKINLLCRKHKVKLLVSDNLSLCLSYGLDGVHFSEKTIKKYASCGRLTKPKPDLIFTAACHSKTALIASERMNMDAVLLSPVFSTKSHPKARCLKAFGFSSLKGKSALHTYALGGINPKTAKRLINSQAVGFAGIGNLLP